MDLEIGPATKSVVSVVALGLLLVAERLAPATAAGKGSLRHDAKNLVIGLANGFIGLTLVLWILPAAPTAGQGLIGFLGFTGVGAALLAFVLLDLWMYAWHRMAHGVPLLWRVHRMHHSDESLDASSGVRFHPFEPALSVVLRLPLLWALGITAADIILYEAVFFPVVVLHHSNMRLPLLLDRALRLMIVTPALHRIHHSPMPPETNSNFGSVLSVWDRIAVSFRSWSRLASPAFGLAGMSGRRWQSLQGLLATPFRREPAAGAHHVRDSGTT